MKSIPLTVFLLSVVFWLSGTTLYFFNRDVFVLTAIISFYFSWMVWIGFGSKSFQLKFQNKILSRFPYLFLIALSALVISNWFRTPLLIYVIFSALAIVFGLGSLRAMKYEKDLDESSELKEKNFSLFVMFLFCLILGVYLYLNIHNSTIDSDEIRLLFDAKLITQGIVPFKEFNARAPVLIYLMAFLYHFWGIKIVYYRIFTAIIAWGSSVFLYLISKRFFSQRKALLVSLIYAALPVTLNFLYIKTETFSVFLGLLSVLLFILSRESIKNNYLRYISHLAMLLALLVRPTAILFYIFHFAIVTHSLNKEKWKNELKRLCFEVFSTVSVFLVSTLIFFRSHNSLLYTNTFKDFNVDYYSFSRFLLTPYYISLTIIICSSIMLLDLFQNQLRNKSKLLIAMTLMLITLSIIYIINTFLLGFWPQYYMDFAVPFAILAAYGIIYIPKVSDKSKFVSVALTIIIFISFLQSYKPLYEYFHRINLSLSYLQQTSKVIDSNTNNGAIIFSGNPEFALISNRKQFLNLSHSYYDPKTVEFVTQKINQQKPSLIIVDDYINRYYLENSSFQNLLSSCYQQIDYSNVYKLSSLCR